MKRMGNLKLDTTQKIWISSDFHYGQKNIVRGVSDWRNSEGKVPIESTRDFPSVDLMNNTIVNNINSCVGQDDILISLGDFSFGGVENIHKFRERIICKTIYHLYGNHDSNILKNCDNTQELFTELFDYLELEYNKYVFILMHYPISSWNGIRKGHIHLFGHQHSRPENKFRKGKSMDVGIDSREEFRPYNINEIISIMDKRPIEIELGDHHGDGIIK